MGDDTLGNGRVQFGQETPKSVIDTREGLLKRLWRIFVVRPAFAWQQWRCYWAHRYLLTHDSDYRFDYVSHEIVKRRQKLYDKGVSPADPSIPDRWSIEDELPPMAWPNKGL